MKVSRQVIMKADTFAVGDQIKVKLDGFGKFTATAQAITEKGTLFFMDDCVAKAQMNATNTNEGGFLASDLCRWMNTVLYAALPAKLRNRIVQDADGNFLTLPTYGQVFGCDNDDTWDQENIEIDQVQQLPLMKNRKNRVCDCNGDWCWYWLQNPLKKEMSSAHFAGVASRGSAGANGASNSAGVRPAFLIA